MSFLQNAALPRSSEQEPGVSRFAFLEVSPGTNHRATPLTFSAVRYAPSPSIPNSSGIIVP